MRSFITRFGHIAKSMPFIIWSMIVLMLGACATVSTVFCFQLLPLPTVSLLPGYETPYKAVSSMGWENPLRVESWRKSSGVRTRQQLLSLLGLPSAESPDGRSLVWLGVDREWMPEVGRHGILGFYGAHASYAITLVRGVFDEEDVLKDLSVRYHGGVDFKRRIIGSKSPPSFPPERFHGDPVMIIPRDGRSM